MLGWADEDDSGKDLKGKRLEVSKRRLSTRGALRRHARVSVKYERGASEAESQGHSDTHKHNWSLDGTSSEVRQKR